MVPDAPAAAPPAPAADAPAEGQVSEQTAESTAAQAEAAEQAAPEKPAELSDNKAANEEEAANERAAELLGTETKQEPAETPEAETPEAKEGGEAAEAAAETDPKEAAEDVPKEGVTALAAELFPDKQVQSDQEAVEAITEYVNETREYREKQEGATKRLSELFRGNPDLVDLIHLMNEGASMSEALPYVTGEADDTGLEGAKEGWQKTAAEKRKARADQEKSLQETTENLNLSMQNVKAFAEENDMSDEDAAELLETIDDVMMNVSKGNITGEILTKLTKGLRYDKTIQDETEKAEIKGRNEAIKEKRTKEAETKGDGLPHPKSTGTEKAGAEEAESPSDIIGRGIDHFTTTRKF